MKLRKVIILIILVCFGFLVAFLFASTRVLTYKKFNEIEESLITANLRRSSNAINGINASLSQLVADWAYWDDSYTFLQDKNQQFIEANLPVVTFQSQQNNLIILLNTKRELVWGKYLIPGEEQFSALPSGTLEVVQELLDDSTINKKQAGFNGIVALQDKIFIISCKSVLTTNRTGPSTGWLIMGKEFSPEILEELKQRTELAIDLINIKSQVIPQRLRQTLGNETAKKKLSIIEKDEETIRCTGLINDVKGIPVALMTVNTPRTVYTSGVEASNRLLAIIVVTGILVGWLLLWLIEQKILSRIALLNDQVSSIKGSDPAMFTTLAGHDEISNLSRSIFNMLLKIQKNFEDLKEMQHSLTDSEERYKSLFMNTGNPCVVVAEDTTIQLANQEFYKRMKIPEGEHIEGRSWAEFFPPDEVERMMRYHHSRRQDDSFAPRTYEVRFKDYNDRIRNGILTVAMIPGTTSSSCSLLDITDQKKAEEALVQKAFYDSLTSLPNRQLFNDRLQHGIKLAIRTKAMIGVFLLDIDEFKSVNDTLGHQAGDTVLQQIAIRIGGCIRKSDTIARLGGDEFAIMIETPAHVDNLCLIAEKIIADFNTPYVINNIEFHLGVSVGISVFPEAGDSPEVLLKNADLAMYESKLKGKNRYNIFTHSLNEQAQQRNIVDRFIRNAIASESFEVFYQPKIFLDDGRLLSMEALVRGKDALGNPVSPGEFIPYAEANGLIVPIDILVLKSACRQTAQWQNEGLGHLVVAVNISTKHFRRQNFVEEVAEILQETGLPPSCLELEITESAMMKDIDQAISSLKRFRNMGVSFALDDFGTGYSSLNYLHNLPIQTLKIDKSFIDHICDETTNTLELVRIVISLASAMKMQVVAEGVESQTQLKVLQEIGCGQGQGYLFSKPLPHEDFHELLLRNSMKGVWSEKGWFGNS